MNPSHLVQPLLIGGLGTTELLIILGIVILIFGATKLPELARGSGRALRIFKAETKGLMDDDDDKPAEGPVARTELAEPEPHVDPIAPVTPVRPVER